MSYRALLFDLDDTLIDFGKGQQIALDQTCHELFPSDRRAEIKKQFQQINHALWDLVSTGQMTPSRLKNERFEKLVELMKLDLEPHLIARKYETYLGEQVIWFPGVPESLSHFKRRYKAGVVTNGLTNVQKQKYEKGQMHSYFDCFVISESVGVSKPDKRIFEIAFEEMGIAPHETLMIGDSLENDYQGAMNCGMDFCWINALHKPFPSHLPHPKFQFSSIIHLQQALV
jgi:2-haloacid dehalogenase